MSTEKLPLHPERILEENVPREIVAKNYLGSELHKLFPLHSTIAQQAVEEMLSTVQGKDTWRLLEAMGVTYRTNGIFWVVSNAGYRWNKELWSASDIQLTGINPAADRVIHSPGIQGNPLRFKDYLHTYFPSHPQDDPEELQEFRPSGRPVIPSPLLFREKEGICSVFDGAHRLMEILQTTNNPFIEAYVGRKVDSKLMPMTGDSLFFQFLRIYQHAPPEHKPAVITTLRSVMDISSDAKEAIQHYWIDGASEEIRTIGISLLASLGEGKA